MPVVSLVLLSFVALLSSPLRGAECETPEATLRAVTGTVALGVAPSFRLTLLNACSHEIRVLSPERLLVEPFILTVSRAGKRVSFGSAIADPPPVQPSQIIALQPGELRTFELTRFKEDLTSFEVGTYQVQLSFPPRPGPGFKTSVATFHVRRPRSGT